MRNAYLHELAWNAQLVLSKDDFSQKKYHMSIHNFKETIVRRTRSTLNSVVQFPQRLNCGNGELLYEYEV